MKPAITIYDVAREARVSITTVSNVLNRPDRVSTATRARVLEVVDDLHYIPKPQAASLARSNTRRIAVFAPFTTYESYLRRLVGLLEECKREGLETVLYDHDSAATLTDPVLAGLPLRAAFDGVIVMGMGVDASTSKRLAERRVPTVLVDAPGADLSAVVAADAEGGRMAAEHLLALGHRRIGYLVERQVADYESQAHLRVEGFRDALARHEDTDLVVVETASGAAAVRAVVLDLLRRDDRPTALMSHFDDMAVSAWDAARELGASVPQDVSVMGYDDGLLARGAGLSTVRQEFEESGRLAVRLLMSEMTDGPRARTVTRMDNGLVVRRSTAVVPVHVKSFA